MARSIRYRLEPTRAPAAAGGPAAPPPPDQPKDKILKLIPAEVLTFYLAVAGILKAWPRDDVRWYLFAAFVAGAVFTPVYLRRVTGNESPGPASKQYVLTTAAFIVWALATSTPLAPLVHLPEPATALLLPFFTLVSGGL